MLFGYITSIEVFGDVPVLHLQADLTGDEADQVAGAALAALCQDPVFDSVSYVQVTSIGHRGGAMAVNSAGCLMGRGDRT